MRTAVRAAAAATVLAVAALIAGCGSPAPAAAPGPAPQAPPAGAPLLATSLVTPAGTWAAAVMGGSVASRNNFWQLFIRPAGSQRWKLITPAGVPDNGGLVLTAAGQSLITAFRPSQYLTYTPLTATSDGGQAWTSTGPLDGALANVPDALSAAPGTGRLIALLADGTAEQAAPAYTRWSTLASRRTLAATAAGRHCGLENLTAAAVSPAGQPLLAGSCSQPGATGIFADTGGTWHAAGPALPASLATQHVQVLRLTSTPNGTVALLAAGSILLAAWTAGNSPRWVLSPPLRLTSTRLISASFGPGGATAIVLTSGHGETITGPGASWRSLSSLPPRTTTIALGPAAELTALAVNRTLMTIWQLTPRSTAWAKIQVINVPIQFGSSS
jgi:hypothetical protein